MTKMTWAKASIYAFFAVVIIFAYQNCSQGFTTLSSQLPQASDSFTASVASGKVLFASNCISCHNGPDSSDATKTSKVDKTSGQIAGAISTVSPMNTLGNLKQLTALQLDAIAAYLNSRSSSASCRPNFTPERTPLRILSNAEYDNLAVDIFFSKQQASIDAKFDIPAAGVSGFTNTSLTSDATAPPITDVMVEKFWTAAGAIADEVIASKSQSGGAYSKLAACAVGAATVADTCYDSIIRSVGLKAWRRPLSEASTANEFTRLKSIFKAGSTFDIGFHDFIKSVLISPNYLVVSLKPNTNLSTGQVFYLDDFQLASRLSFFLWQSAPDDELLNLAKLGTLSNVSNLQLQVSRMLKDSRSKRLAAVMNNEWLGLNKIQGLGLTTVDAGTLSSMVSESQFMFEDIIASDVSFLNSISANYSFLNKTMADYYGVPFTGAVATQFYKTSIASTPRRGILNQAAFLIATAGSPNQTHPVLRGKIVSNKIGCYDIAPPPALLDTSLPQNIPANSTPAEILTLHTQRAQCAGCHNTLDPHGLPLETFDSKGIWRTNYVDIANRAIDQTGALPSGESFSSTAQFMSALANSQTIKSCLVRQVMSVGLTRRVASLDDKCSANAMSPTVMSATAKFSDLINGIVMSRQFRTQTTEAP